MHLPCHCFLLAAFTWARGGHRQIRELPSEPSDTLAHSSSKLAVTFLLPYLLTLALFTDTSMCVVTVYFTYF